MTIGVIEKDTGIAAVAALCADVHSKEEAEFLISFLSSTRPISQVKSDLGYFFGRASFPERLRLEELFQCEHPIFGSAKELGQPLPEEAYILGQYAGHNNGFITLKELRKRGIKSVKEELKSYEHQK